MSSSNHSRPQHPTLNYFQGSPYRQYGSGIGTAIKAGLKGFVIPMIKRYGFPVAKFFLQQTAPEVINLLDGSTKPKAAMKNALKKPSDNKLAPVTVAVLVVLLAEKRSPHETKKEIEAKEEKQTAPSKIVEK